MLTKSHKTDFGQFIFLDDYTVVAAANEGANIDRTKVQYAVDLVEKELTGDYAMILDRKADYSIVPIEVYQFFSGIERLKALAIVSYTKHEFLPDNMEQTLYKKEMKKFSSIDDAHEWIKNIFKQ